MKHARISGYLLLATGLLHTLNGVVGGYSYLSAMARDGIVNTVSASPNARCFSGFWSLV